MRAVQEARRRALRRALACVAALASAAVLGACAGGEDEPGAVAPSAGFNQEQPGRQLRCSDWKDADPSGRRAIVDRLQAFIGGPVTGEGFEARGTVLKDEQAHDLFNTRCEHFSGFLLYKLYSHAAAFAGGPPE
jgi:hypothetical protein